MKIALITLSNEGRHIIEHLMKGLPEAKVFVHDLVDRAPQGAARFGSILELTENIFSQYEGLVYVAPCGVVVRALAPNIRHKTTDPAVVMVDVGARYAVSLLSGHEGGANELTVSVANILGAEPVISTTTEALKTVIVGIGCRRGIEARAIIDAVKDALELVSVCLEHVRFLASADIKANEQGLLQAAHQLGIPLRFITSEEIRASERAFTHSDFVKEKVDLPAVAEPAALLAGRRTSLILPKKSYNGVTIAIAREAMEDCLWSE